MRRAIRLPVLLVLAVVTSVEVFAQSTPSSSLTGVVKDSTGGVVPEVTVQISSASLIGGPRQTLTDSRGSYRFLGLPPGVYEVAASRQGFRTTKSGDIPMSVGATMTVDLQLEVAAIGQAVEVRAAAPVIDVTSATAPTNFDEHLLQNLPVGRTLTDIINLAPGVTAEVGFGGAQGSNARLIDGVNTSDPNFGRNLAAIDFNYNWIQEVQVISLGANAEHGDSTGVVATAILRSGSNRFSGLGEYYTSRPRWAADNTSSLPEGLRQGIGGFHYYRRLTDWESSGQLGGPLVRDRVWIFSGVQLVRLFTRAARVGGPERSDDRQAKFMTKLTTAPSPALRVEGYYEQDAQETTGVGLSSYRPEALWVYEYLHKVWNGRLTWTANERAFLDVRAGGYRSSFSVNPTPPNDRSGPAPHFDLVTGVWSVNAPYFHRWAPKPWNAAATFTIDTDKLAGRHHAFKFGVEYERAKSPDEFGWTAGRLFRDRAGEPFLVILAEKEHHDPLSSRVAAYVQDDWTVTARLTIHPGVRFSFNRGSAPDGGHVFSTNPVSPRIGFAWDLAADHKTVLRAHYGRYHDTLLTNHYQFMHTSGQPPTIQARVVGPDQFVEISRFEPRTSFGIDPGIEHSYADQFFAGIERELFTDLSFQVQYVGREFKDFMGFLDTRSVYEPVERRDPGPDGRLGTADDGGLITVFSKTNPGNEFLLLTNPPGAFRRHTAFQLVGRKRYSRQWEALASYTWSRTEGNNNNQFGSNTAWFDVGQNGVFANPNKAINAKGPTAFDYTHDLKVVGGYRFGIWGGIHASAVYRYRTGLAWGRVANIFGLRQGVETVRIEPRGTRRLPALNSLDLRVEKTLTFGTEQRTLGIFADVFNVNNQGAPDSDRIFAISDASGPSFGNPVVWMEPRLLRVGVRLTF